MAQETVSGAIIFLRRSPRINVYAIYQKRSADQKISWEHIQFGQTARNEETPSLARRYFIHSLHLCPFYPTEVFS